MNTKILTTHVGSLPRSKALSELLFAKDKGDSFSENEFDDVVKQNVSDIVKKQLDIGIDFEAGFDGHGLIEVGQFCGAMPEAHGSIGYDMGFDLDMDFYYVGIGLEVMGR